MGFIGAILFMLLSAILIIAVMGISLLARLFGGLSNLWRVVTGGNRGTQQSAYRRPGNNTNNGSNAKANSNTANQGARPRSNGKVFSDDEGTYVDFEEI